MPFEEYGILLEQNQSVNKDIQTHLKAYSNRNKEINGVQGYDVVIWEAHRRK